MVRKEIQELCNLYTETTRRFRAIKSDYLDEEEALEHDVHIDIKNYLNSLLDIIPKDIEAHCCDRLSIYLCKSISCNKDGGETQWMDIVIISDTNTHSCMVFNELFYDWEFTGFDKKADYLRLTTLEYLCFHWKEIKREICRQTAEQLDSFITRRLEQIKAKQEKLQVFSDWRGV